VGCRWLEARWSLTRSLSVTLFYSANVVAELIPVFDHANVIRFPVRHFQSCIFSRLNTGTKFGWCLRRHRCQLWYISYLSCGGLGLDRSVSVELTPHVTRHD